MGSRKVKPQKIEILRRFCGIVSSTQPFPVLHLSLKEQWIWFKRIAWMAEAQTSGTSVSRKRVSTYEAEVKKTVLRVIPVITGTDILKLDVTLTRLSMRNGEYTKGLQDAGNGIRME